MRLIRQLLAESLLLAVMGGILGVAIAEIGVRALVALSPPGLPRIGAIGVDGVVFAFGLGITSLVGLIVGLAPALRASHSDPHNALQQSSRTTAGGHRLTRRILVVSEVALALVLLVGAGLLLRSLKHLFAIDPGFDSGYLLTMQVQESGRRFNDDSARARFFTLALEAVGKVPGVTGAAFTSQLPLSGDFDVYGLQLELHPNDNSDGLFRYAVTPAYFGTMGIPLRAGRLLDERDRFGGPRAVLISESFAKRKFPNQNPVGQRVRLGARHRTRGPSVGRHRRRGGRRETDVSRRERIGCFLYHNHTVGLGGHRAIAGGSHPRRCRGAGSSNSKSNLVRGQGPAGFACHHNGQPARHLAGRTPFCADPV